MEKIAAPSMAGSKVIEYYLYSTLFDPMRVLSDALVVHEYGFADVQVEPIIALDVEETLRVLW